MWSAKQNDMPNKYACFSKKKKKNKQNQFSIEKLNGFSLFGNYIYQNWLFIKVHDPINKSRSHWIAKIN